ncbi:fungal fucose-specific lectin [Armillaria gallica]|uniref:Fungal fucose-specific lectin n=1 Tax=Armillaria gallica TaxID=47427 RepID=A0A2H3EE13_ARMGA|nr:fungal fucose-specific lectin [Armillaria gallica]
MCRAREIVPGTSIAATALSPTPIRVYFQDSSNGVREFSHSWAGWTGGTSHDIRFQAKPRSPLAVMEWVEGDKTRHIRIYALDKQNIIHEQCWDRSKGWHQGSLTSKAIVPASFSKLATTLWLGRSDLRVYYQRDDQRIQEHRYSSGTGWTLGATMGALLDTKPYKGTNIASIGWGTPGRSFIRNYVQDEDNAIWEHSSESSWSSLRLVGAVGKPYTPLAAVTWSDGKHGRRHIHLYSLDMDNQIQEYCYEGHDWHGGSLTSKKIQTAPYSNLSAIYWDSKIRVYFQSVDNGTIAEYCTDYGSEWFPGDVLSATPAGFKAIDTNGATYPVGWLPWIEDLKSWQTYDPSTIDAVGVLVGFIDGKLIGEDLKNQNAMILKPNTIGNSYA